MPEIIYMPPTHPVDRMRDACQSLGKWISGLPKPKDVKRNNRKWEFLRSYEIDHYGEESITSLLPEKLDRGQNRIIQLVNLLGEWGYHTRRDLAFLTRKDLDEISGFKETNIEPTLALAEIARAKNELAETKGV